ncbi:MAG: response regulator [Ktedonobacterales bacterium]|nr:response regulator [Ktedonobacterales bacterium]
MAHVLIVDDDNEIRMTLRMLLEDAGHIVEEAASGQACLQLLRTTPSRMVVLLDLIMPVMNGLHVLEAIQAEPVALARHTYILMTADNRLMLTQAAPLLTALAVTLVRKPFDVDALLITVDHAAQRLT